MTEDEWDGVLNAAIRESGKDATILSSGCSDKSNRCFATIEEPATGKRTEIGADQSGAAIMQKSVVRQLMAEESS